MLCVIKYPRTDPCRDVLALEGPNYALLIVWRSSEKPSAPRAWLAGVSGINAAESPCLRI